MLHEKKAADTIVFQIRVNAILWFTNWASGATLVFHLTCLVSLIRTISWLSHQTISIPLMVWLCHNLLLRAIINLSQLNTSQRRLIAQLCHKLLRAIVNLKQMLALQQILINKSWLKIIKEMQPRHRLKTLSVTMIITKLKLAARDLR